MWKVCSYPPLLLHRMCWLPFLAFLATPSLIRGSRSPLQLPKTTKKCICIQPNICYMCSRDGKGGYLSMRSKSGGAVGVVEVACALTWHIVLQPWDDFYHTCLDVEGFIHTRSEIMGILTGPLFFFFNCSLNLRIYWQPVQRTDTLCECKYEIVCRNVSFTGTAYLYTTPLYQFCCIL